MQNLLPSIPRFRNETFFKTTRYPGEGKNEAKVVDMFFGPYKDTQALYIVKYGNHDTVLRIRYTGIHDEPPSVNFTVSNQKVDVNETVQLMEVAVMILRARRSLSNGFLVIDQLRRK